MRAATNSRCTPRIIPSKWTSIKLEYRKDVQVIVRAVQICWSVFCMNYQKSSLPILPVASPLFYEPGAEIYYVGFYSGVCSKRGKGIFL